MPVASPNLVQTAPSWAGSLEARQVWARLAPGRAASRKELCQIRALSGAGALRYWRRTRLHPSKACSSRRLGCLLFPGGGSLPLVLYTRLPGGAIPRLLQVLAQGLLPLSWGCGREPRHAGAGPNNLHTALLGRRALGNLCISGKWWETTSESPACWLQTPPRGPGCMVLSMWR